MRRTEELEDEVEEEADVEREERRRRRVLDEELGFSCGGERGERKKDARGGVACNGVCARSQKRSLAMIVFL